MSAPDQLYPVRTDNVVFKSVEDMICESAIEDDNDSSDWEDSNDGSGNASLDEKAFRRIDLRSSLHQSQLTIMLHSSGRYNSPVSTSSNSTSPIRKSQHLSSRDSSSAMSYQSEKTAPLETQGLQEIADTLTSSTQPFPIYNQIDTPRTIRRKMLMMELSTSLCQGLIEERNQSRNAALVPTRKQDGVSSLKQYREEAHIEKKDKDEDNRDDKWFTCIFQQSGYNSRGW